eukprot:2078432-Rhodomonas_salina.1
MGCGVSRWTDSVDDQIEGTGPEAAKRGRVPGKPHIRSPTTSPAIKIVGLGRSSRWTCCQIGVGDVTSPTAVSLSM